MRRFAARFGAFLIVLSAGIGVLTAQTGPVRYIYDELGRLVGVVDGTGASAVYVYDAVGNLLSIQRQAAGAVSIIEFTPNGGPVGTTVTILGTGFSATASQNTLTFNGTAATVTSATANQLVTTVPAGATTGLISVTTPSGSAASPVPFVVGTASAPTISGFSPAVGVAGTSVTISGTNYDSVPANNKVRFNGALALVSSAAATSIQTTVPTQTGSGRIKVSTPGGTAISTSDFFVPPSPYTAGEVLVTDRVTFGQTKSVALGTPGKIAMVVFDGTAGQRVSAGITLTSGGGFGCYWYLKILNPDNTTLASAQACGGTVLFLEPFTLPSTGTYTALVDADGTFTGTVDLLVSAFTDITGSITPNGASVSVAITAPGQNGRLTFSGTAGQQISASMTLTSGGTFTCLWYLNILKPDNTPLGSTFGCNTSQTFLDAQTLPTTGTYTLLVDPNLMQTGTVDVQLYGFSDVTGSIVQNGSNVSVSITSPGQNGRLTFSGTAGQQVSATITLTSGGSFGCLWYLTILKPDNTALATASACGGTLLFLNSQTLPTTGTYTLLIDPNAMQTGTVNGQLYGFSDVSGPIVANGSSVSVPLTTPGQNGRLTFSGTAAQQVSASITLTSGGSFSCYWLLVILKPDGTTLNWTYACSGTVLSLSNQTLPSTGTYTLLIDPDGMLTGTVSATLTSP